MIIYVKGEFNMCWFKKYGNNLTHEDVLHLDASFSVSHINYDKSPIFNRANIKDLNIESLNDSIVTRGKIEDVLSLMHSFDGTEKDFNYNDRILLWRMFWLEYINAFDQLNNLLPNSIVTIYTGRQAIEIGFKYLLLLSTGTIVKTHDLAKLSALLFKEYNINEEYMDDVDLFCENYCQYIEGGNAEYFRYPEYRKKSYFSGSALDISWLSYNFVLIIKKLIYFAQLEDEILT